MPIHGGTQVENKGTKGEEQPWKTHNSKKEIKKERRQRNSWKDRRALIQFTLQDQQLSVAGRVGNAKGGGVVSLALSATKACENNICAKYFTAKFSRQEVNEKAFKKLWQVRLMRGREGGGEGVEHWWCCLKADNRQCESTPASMQDTINSHCHLPSANWKCTAQSNDPIHDPMPRHPAMSPLKFNEPYNLRATNWLAVKYLCTGTDSDNKMACNLLKA